MQAACPAAGECQALQLKLLVQPSTAPIAIVLVLADNPLQTVVMYRPYKCLRTDPINVCAQTL